MDEMHRTCQWYATVCRSAWESWRDVVTCDVTASVAVASAASEMSLAVVVDILSSTHVVVVVVVVA